MKKETLAQLFSCEFWEISKNTFSYKTPLVAASEHINDETHQESKGVGILRKLQTILPRTSLLIHMFINRS